MYYISTTLRGTFDHYTTETSTLRNGDVVHHVKVVLKNCTDTNSMITYPEISFNLTKSFQQFGMITDHPVIEVSCRQYLNENDNNYGYRFPSNVSFANNYQKFTGDFTTDKKMIDELV